MGGESVGTFTPAQATCTPGKVRAAPWRHPLWGPPSWAAATGNEGLRCPVISDPPHISAAPRPKRSLKRGNHLCARHVRPRHPTLEQNRPGKAQADAGEL